MMRRTVCALRSLRPLGQRILVQREVSESTTASGVLIPEKARKKINEASVVAVPDNTADFESPVAVGDKVLLPEWGGTKVTLDGKEMTLVEIRDIMGKLQ
eukprot:Hpha_TRINITY_DN35291_c0_g1::TRINITY_DN35291_c0_g1_i1::g.145130::m.145130/K04078/groES, HSPE1; chaperonin GroES